MTETLKPLLAEAGEDAPVYFEDAVHMRHNSQAAYGWILKGKSKELKQNSGRVRININGAVCFHNQQVVYREDAKSVRSFAEENDIDLIFLPPYFPNLNLIERLWGRLKRTVTHNRYYEHFSDFHEAVSAFFETIPKQQADLEKLLAPNFNIIGVSC